MAENETYIDVHAHIFPDFYQAAMTAARISDVDGWPSPRWSPEAMFKAMDEHKILPQVLSLSSPGITFATGKDASRVS